MSPSQNNVVIGNVLVLEGKLSGASFGKVLLLVLKGKLIVAKFSSWCNVFYANVLGLEENLLCKLLLSIPLCFF